MSADPAVGGAERRLVTEHHLHDLKYRLGDLRGASVDGACLVRLTGGPVLVTAPHSVTQYRDHGEKAAEFWTGAVAESLANLLGAGALTALRHPPGVPESTPGVGFRRVLDLLLDAGGVRLVIDVHGLAARHGLDIVLGTTGLRDREVVDRLHVRLAQQFAIAVDEPFDGSRGITGRVNSDPGMRALAIQLELGPRLRSDTTTADDLLILADALAEFSDTILGAH